MFANIKTFAVIAACALAAQAQSTTTSTAPASESSLPAGLDTCILSCVTAAATTGGCSSYTDLQCVCTSTAFQSAAQECLQANCTAEDVATATQLQTQECAAIVGSGTSSAASSTPASTGASSATSSHATSSHATSASTTASATSTKNAAVGLAASFEGILAVLVASAGTLVGAVFVF
ncbi:hypothetical protein PAXINDRAFT_172262 [Paxillus involutus ATCC 200175]|uniref:CFEM domain-containing protein n=1 Tax=Paxillus involutus ATCC 200175 TaxID=664439 RepID=A0A0C9T2W7_PAXIN|nr:hypothetical protein PAXINDRAFT_172262 [Paxillus involutus ATCC 200175]